MSRNQQLSVQEENALFNIKIHMGALLNRMGWTRYTASKDLKTNHSYYLVTDSADVVLAEVVNRPSSHTGHVHVRDEAGTVKEVRPFIFKDAYKIGVSNG